MFPHWYQHLPLSFFIIISTLAGLIYISLISNVFGIFSCAHQLFVNLEKNVYLDSLHILKLSYLSSIAELYTFENIFWLLTY